MIYRDLLKSWTDTLVDLQIKENSHPAFSGGILCPACHKIHGRCQDAMIPFLEMARLTGENHYLQAAEKVFYWSEHNVTRENGAYINDGNNSWTGITSFAVIGLAECLMTYEDLISDCMRQDMLSRMRKAADYLLDFIPILQKANINYMFAFATALELSGKILHHKAYCAAGWELMEKAITYIDDDGIIFGEGRPKDEKTPKGGRAIDIGYNVEESIPLMIQYYISNQEETVKQAAVKAMRGHLDFLLPDGGWDNSFGTRNAKWSYWGSRTSDGCQIAYTFFQEEYPEFGYAAYLNFKLLERCTWEGILYGGPMYREAGEEPCIHHTFSHAKTLAFLSAHQVVLSDRFISDRALLDLISDGIKSFSNGKILTLNTGKWRATLSGADYEYAANSTPTGGCLSLLWARDFGPVLAGTMSEYYLQEAANMQIPQRIPVECCTMQITAMLEGKQVSSLNCLNAELLTDKTEDHYILKAKGQLRDEQDNVSCPYEITYTFTDSCVSIDITSKAEELCFYLPIIASENDRIQYITEREISIEKSKAKLLISSSLPITVRKDENTPDGFARVFNPVGGFRYLFMKIPVSDDNGLHAELQLSSQGI